MKNEQPLPGMILEWIKDYEFNGLNEQQRAEVLMYLSEAEYNSLHMAHSQISEVFIRDSSMQPPAYIKQNLDAAFSAHHRAPVSFFQIRIPVWQAAAAVILLIGVTVYLSGYFQTQRAISGPLVVHDTLIQKIPAIAAHFSDTVYRQNPSPHSISRKTPKKPAGIAIAYTDTTAGGHPAGMRLFQPDDLKSNATKTCGKNRREDALANRFAFVKI